MCCGRWRRSELPLPPYIHREGHTDSDLRRYQTVYAERPGAVAAPTAGLHFTPEVFAGLAARGVEKTAITLHVGYGTFKPITAERLEHHYVDPEEFHMGEAAAAKLNATRAAGRRVAAVGTTVTRTLETQYREGNITRARGDGQIHLSAVRIPGRGCAPDELPPAEVEPAGAGIRVCGRS